MRFVWAVAAFVLAALMIGAGIAQRTVFQGPKTATTELSVAQDAPYLLVDGAVLDALAGTPTLRAQGEGGVFAAVARTTDLEAWLSDTDYTQVSVGADGEIASTLVEPAPATTPSPDASAPPADAGATPEPAATTGATDATASDRSPVGSDLWLDEYQEDDILITPLAVSEGQSVLIATDGTAPAPADVAVSWPIGGGTPWAGPLIVAGGVVLAVGVFLYILGIRHVRRSRGPRRKGLPLPVTEPIDLAVEGADKGVISAGRPKRQIEGSRTRRALVAIPAVAVTALVLAGCQSDAWPDFGPTPTPTPSATVIVPEGQQAPAVTKSQAERILTRVAASVADADEAKDPALAATRLEGAALATRETNYTLRNAIADYEALPAIASKPVTILLPQTYDEWPRSFLAVVDDTASKTSSIMVLTQADAWADYKLSYIGSLEASTQMPDLAPDYIGASQVQPDSPFLVLPPEQLAGAYADVLNNGESSTYFGLFDTQNDAFRTSIAADRQKRLDEFNQTASETGTLSFETSAGDSPPFAIATLESGAIVAVNLSETETVKPTSTDAVIKVEGNMTVQTLAGATQSAGGFSTTYSDQLFFYVPGPNSTEKIRLLGYASDILKAQVIS